MLIRIVRMTFQAERCEDFEAIFRESKPKLEALPGCIKAELLQDWDHPTIYITYSHWKDKESLEAYRHSEMFRDIWARTKALFADKPQAFSMRGVIN